MFSEELELFVYIYSLKPSRPFLPHPCGSYKGLTTGSPGIWWPLSFLWPDKVAQLLVSFPTDSANGTGEEGCPSVDREVIRSSHGSDLNLVRVETVCYIKLHSVFSVLLLELLFTGTTQPTALPWAHREPSYNCPHGHSASRLSGAGFFRTHWWRFWQNNFTFPVNLST